MQIYSLICQRINLENLLRLRAVTAMSLMSSFFGARCTCITDNNDDDDDVDDFYWSIIFEQ